MADYRHPCPREDDEDFKCLVSRIKDEVIGYIGRPSLDKQLVTNKIEKKTIEMIEEVTNIEKQGENKQPLANLQSHDGKLIKLNKAQVVNLLDNCEERTIKGGFGTVFITKKAVPGLDIRVVVKKIKCTEDEHTKILTTFNERISRRIMHFAVVPLIGCMEEEIRSPESLSISREYHFVSPYLEKGSLRSYLDQYFKTTVIKDVELEWLDRTEILFQIASAIRYLHTPVKGYRGIVLHMDITSSNIVLDTNLNARLIDFGLAREMNEGKTNVDHTQSRLLGTPGYFRSQSYSKLTVREDCYNFGVVIREILTGQAPYIEKGNKTDELRKHGKNYLKTILQRKIWHHEEKSKVAADVLIELSARCLNTKNLNISSGILLEELKKIRKKSNSFGQSDKCNTCMINTSVKHNIGLTPHRCGEIKVCLSCMRNSYLNPIICPTCGETVIPEIGHTFAALLIAGNDLRNEGLSKSFRNDVVEIRNVLASKYPCVIGIREENIKVVAPICPGQNDNLLAKISSAFECLERKKDINTLIFYYTGHYSSEDGFQLGDRNETLTLQQLKEYLKKFCKERNEVKRIFAFLDCCYAPNLGNIPDITKVEEVKIMQLNICRPCKEAYQTPYGSLFRIFFVQALTRKVFNKSCYITDGQSDCKLCEISGDFISVGKILEYMSRHITDMYRDRDPQQYMTSGYSWKDACFGYNIDFAAYYEFKFQKGEEELIKVDIDRGIFCHIDKLKVSILRHLQNLRDKSLMLPSTEYVDCLSLRIYNGRQDGEELQTMLQISAAMDTEQCVIVLVRRSTSILHGKVALFPPTKEFYDYLKMQDQRFSIESGGKAQITKLSKDELAIVIDELENHDVLKDLNKHLMEVLKEWDEKDNEDIVELKISFPKNEDCPNSAFIVLELERDETPNGDETPNRDSMSE